MGTCRFAYRPERSLTTVLFSRVPEEKAGKNRLHFDLYVGPGERAPLVERLVASGRGSRTAQRKGKVVAVHEFDGLATEHPGAVEFTAVRQHQRKPQVVAGGREQAEASPPEVLPRISRLRVGHVEPAC